MTTLEHIEKLITLIDEKGVQGWEEHGKQLVEALRENQALTADYNPMLEKLAQKALNAYNDLVIYHELVQETAIIHEYRR